MTCVEAFGICFTGSAVSAAARPVNSVPVYANAAVTKTLQKPWKPLRKASYGEFLFERVSRIVIGYQHSHLPISATNIASVVSRHTTAVDYYAQEYEPHASQDFHKTEDEFDLTT